MKESIYTPTTYYLVAVAIEGGFLRAWPVHSCRLPDKPGEEKDRENHLAPVTIETASKYFGEKVASVDIHIIEDMGSNTSRRVKPIVVLFHRRFLQWYRNIFGEHLIRDAQNGKTFKPGHFPDLERAGGGWLGLQHASSARHP